MKTGQDSPPVLVHHDAAHNGKHHGSEHHEYHRDLVAALVRHGAGELGRGHLVQVLTLQEPRILAPAGTLMIIILLRWCSG